MTNKPAPNPDIPQPVNPTRPGPGPKPSGPVRPGPPSPGGPRYTDTLFDLAASLGFQDLGLRGPQGEPPAASAIVAADSEGRAGFYPAPGAVPRGFLPPIPTVRSFDS